MVNNYPLFNGEQVRGKGQRQWHCGFRTGM